MDILAGKELLRKKGNPVTASDALKSVDVVAFYFSASWCPPCRVFTTILADFYKVNDWTVYVSDFFFSN